MSVNNSTGRGSWRIGVDIGGTFTDLVLTGPAGEVHVFKVPSVPADPARGVMNALDRAATGLSLKISELLSECSMFVHGSTVATNTALEHKGARVGLLTTRGFRDSLEIRRGMRDTPWDHRTPNPPVLVPRFLRLPVGGRSDSDGNEIEPLSLDDVRTAAQTFAQEGVESVAICLLNSFANPAHEQAVAQAVKAHWHGQWISVSSDISPLVGEYERTSTTVMNAYVAPRAVSYLRELNERLRARGFPHSILLIQNNGGAISIDQVAGKPVRLLLSGPAAGVGALQFYSRAIGSGNLISMEIGGTSCDVLLMRDGSVPTTDQFQDEAAQHIPARGRCAHLQHMDGRQREEHGHWVVHAGLKLQRAADAGIDGHTLAMKQHEDGRSIGGGEDGAHQDAFQRMHAHDQDGHAGHAQGGQQHTDRRQGQGRPEHQPDDFARRAQATFEQDDGKGDRPHRERRLIALELQSEQAFLAGQHAQDKKHKEQRGPEPGRDLAQEDADEGQERAQEDQLIDKGQIEITSYFRT